MLDKSIRKEIKNQIGKYGKISEEDDRFIVNVKQNKVYKNIEKGFLCTGISDDVMKKLEMSKGVYYIFENIIFDRITTIYASNADLLFKNCKFYNTLNVLNANSITLENNKCVFYETDKTKNRLKFICKKILIKNNDFINTAFSKKFQEPSVNISLLGEQIEVENSNICSEYAGNINLVADKISLKSSAINGPTVYLSGNDISTTKSIISASHLVEIDNKSCSFSCAVKAPTVIYNGIKINHKKQILEIDKEKEALISARLELINKLQAIKDNCTRINEENLIEVQNQLKNKKICKVLKK